MMTAEKLERFCEIIAAMKIRTTNKKGRHLSTARVIELLEGEGIETPDGLIVAPPGLLHRATVDRHLRQRGADQARTSRGALPGKARQ
jgi:beta-lactamase superfamily II metal-dependent hydrolase